MQGADERKLSKMGFVEPDKTSSPFYNISGAQKAYAPPPAVVPRGRGSNYNRGRPRVGAA